jgi:hypothetical protein
MTEEDEWFQWYRERIPVDKMSDGELRKGIAESLSKRSSRGLTKEEVREILDEEMKTYGYIVIDQPVDADATWKKMMEEKKKRAR